MMSRILGVVMTLLFSLPFLMNKTRGNKAVSCFYRFSILDYIFSSFLGGDNPHSSGNWSVRLFISGLFTTEFSCTWLLLDPKERIRRRI